MEEISEKENLKILYLFTHFVSFFNHFFDIKSKEQEKYADLIFKSIHLYKTSTDRNLK